jgi:hypothetical protein
VRDETRCHRSKAPKKEVDTWSLRRNAPRNHEIAGALDGPITGTPTFCSRSSHRQARFQGVTARVMCPVQHRCNCQRRLLIESNNSPA